MANLDRIEAEHSTAPRTRQGERYANTNEVRDNGSQQYCQPILIKLNDGLHARFGPTQFEDFFGDLTKLQQADMLAGRPTSLTSAIGLARLYEVRNTSQRHFTTGGEAVPEISLHAIAGTSVVETTRVQGKSGHTSTIVLVDSGSTHNFMSEKLAQKVRIQPKTEEHFKVMVASEKKLSSQGLCT
ncbi:hypothetical protein ACOSQ4_003972 [Xanthoceras sorbifolium]